MLFSTRSIRCSHVLPQSTEVETVPVTRFEVRQRRPLAGGAGFPGPASEVGPYEEMKGRLFFSIDPLPPSNRRVTDVDLAPRAANGRVEWSADVSILLPVDRIRCS